jgi:predicted enzyme related to lactoylglutathione lyase
MTMDITIHASALPHDDPDAALAFYRDALGFEVRTDVGQGQMRWITVGPPGQPDTSILLAPPAADPGITDDERATIAAMMAKGTYGWILLAADDLDATFEQLQASDAEVVQEPGRPFRFSGPVGHEAVRPGASSRCARTQRRALAAGQGPVRAGRGRYSANRGSRGAARAVGDGRAAWSLRRRGAGGSRWTG